MLPEKLPGTKLSSKELYEEVISVWHEPKLEYRWSAGIAIGKFLSGLKEGKILASKCDNCGRVLVPPRIFCEWCFRRTDEWVEVKDTGRVNTFSVCYIDVAARRVKEPQIPAVIEIDGSNGGILHLLGEVNPKEIEIGMRVKAVWKPKEERIGAITDIKYFKPL